MTFSHRPTGHLDAVVDGNALAGPLLGLLGVDATSLSLTCRRCGRAGAIAETIKTIKKTVEAHTK